MKKLFVVLLTVLMVLTLAGCKEDEPEKKVDPNAKADGVMTYAQYVAANLEEKVVIEGFVVASQSYWNGATLYVADGDGAYFVYGDGKTPNISEEEWKKLGITGGDAYVGLAKTGVKVHVEGYKAEWAGEIEISDATVTIVDTTDTYLPNPVEIKASEADTWVSKYGNQYVTIKDAKVTKAALYKWDGSGTAGTNSDLYIEFEIGGQNYTFCVESYLMYEGSDCYNAVLALKEGDVVAITGFMYAYNGPQMHITGITK